MVLSHLKIDLAIFNQKELGLLFSPVEYYLPIV
jgi:hypothetical protein